MPIQYQTCDSYMPKKAQIELFLAYFWHILWNKINKFKNKEVIIYFIITYK